GQKAELNWKVEKEIIASNDSVKYSQKELLLKDGEPPANNAHTSYYHKGRTTSIRDATFVEIYNVGAAAPRHPPELLLSMGMSLTINGRSKLTDLMTRDETITRYDDEVLRGKKVAVLGIGPQLRIVGNPESPELQHLWIKAWLSIDDQYFPLKIVVHYPLREDIFKLASTVQVETIQNPSGQSMSYMLNTYEVLELGVAPDESRKKTIPFPKKVRNETGLISESTCTMAIINPKVLPSVFEPVIPTNAQVTINGKFQYGRSPKTSAAARHAVNAATTRDMLAEEIPASPEKSTVQKMWPWSILAAACIGMLYWIARRCLNN
ncbi:MAG: hypothetical protein V4719_08655, partial [Planctomycetota bacterium]